MADVKISALPASTTPLAGTEVLPIVQSSTTKQVSVANLTAGRAVSALSLTSTTTLDVTGTSTLSGNAIISVTDNTNAALRITQLGTGNALLVEDSTNPDASPFVIDASGNVIVGNTAQYAISGTTPKNIQSSTTSGASGFASILWSSSVAGSAPSVNLLKSRGAAQGAYLAVASGDLLGALNFAGDDGTAFIQAASISASVDGTPGTNDMPGRLVFSTTADGASSSTERMRISSTGQTTISGNAIISVTDNTNAALRITQLGTGNALLVEDSTNPDASPFVIDAAGQVVVGNSTSIANTALEVVNSITRFTYANNAFAGGISQRKSRSTTIGTKVIVQSGDELGNLFFYGDDGSTDLIAARITASVDGTPGTNDMPGRLVFSTTADGASSPTERMRIDSAGIVTMSAYGAGAATFSAAGVISSVSDETYKIKDGVIADPIPMIMALEAGYYYGKPEANMGEGRQLGFYAQNVRTAIGPEAAPDPGTYIVTDKDGVETIKTKPWGYYDRSVLAVAIEAIKVQQAQITALTARIAALENK